MSNPPKIRFSTFPRTKVPADFISDVVEVFQANFCEIGTSQQKKGLTSDEMLAVLRDDLTSLGFDVEASKLAKDKIRRPVFFGENARPDLQYELIWPFLVKRTACIPRPDGCALRGRL